MCTYNKKSPNASYGVYILQRTRFARVCNQVTDFNRAIGIKNFEKPFSKFYRRHYELISKYNVGTLLSEGLTEPEFYGNLVYKFKKLIGKYDFSFQFREIITRYRRG